MGKKVIVNHVMSSDMHSAIFDALLGYFQSLKSPCFEHLVTVDPDPDVDVYHFHRPNLAKDIPNKSISTVHHDLNDGDAWLDASNFVNAYKKNAVVACLNSQQAKILREDYGIEQTVVIPHGVNKSLFDEMVIKEERLPFGEKITLGVLSKRYGRKVKGEFRLYEIAKRLDPNRFNFILVGDGRMKDYQILRRLGFDVLCYSYLPYELMPQIYNELDGLLMLSNYEGGPASLPEAIYSRTPIFSTRVGMAIDLIDPESNLNGIFLKENFDEMANQIKEYFMEGSDPVSFTKIPDWKDVVGKYENVYLRVLGNEF
ncbi:glycosyltransferase family 4 protein [Microbulbifer aggregans]|uniref:glycosyltransferase family 4 protein n=1 Tax=Microbulbifer aggregans TaxID=1769779 RepID=UPI001CFE4D03|nr:glycosyltransferase family 4 protein [Microbulbifer aggregans]